MSHGITKCQVCRETIRRCRCPGPHVTTWGTCDKCIREQRRQVGSIGVITDGRDVTLFTTHSPDNAIKIEAADKVEAAYLLLQTLSVADLHHVLRRIVAEGST